MSRLDVFFTVEGIHILEREAKSHVHERLHQVFHIALNNSMETCDVFTHEHNFIQFNFIPSL